jgi:VWFA-related protein
VGKIAAVALLLAAAASAQMRESVTVELIEVPVYVTAAGGAPLRGLGREAFSLRVDGKARPIEYFEEVDLSRDAAKAPLLRQRRLYLFVFDLFFNRATDVARAQKAAAQIVSRANPATDFFAVATYSARDGLQFVIPFLNDAAAVRRAVATHAPPGHDALGLATFVAERDYVDTDNVSHIVGGAAAGRHGSELGSTLNGGLANLEQLSEPRRYLAEHQLDGLGDAAVRLRALEGQKHVVVFSNGFGARIFTGMPEAMPFQARFRTDVSRIYRAFAGAGVFLDAVDTAGGQTFDASEPLRQLSAATGGTLVRGDNDLVHALERLTAAQESYYLLGFTRRDGGEGTIDVRVAGLPRGARVSHRTGYGRPATATATDIDPLQLADVVTNDIARNDLTLTLDAAPRDGAAELTVTLRPSEAVALRATGLDAYLYVFDANGATAFTKTLRLPVDAAGIRERVPLPPGRYVVKVLVHAAGTASLGFARASLEVTPR